MTGVSLVTTGGGRASDFPFPGSPWERGGYCGLEIDRDLNASINLERAAS